MTQMNARLWHIGLTVSDLDRSVHFYRDLLGFELKHRQDEQSPDFDRLSANAGTHVLVAWLTDGHVVLQLIQYLAGGDGAVELKHSRVGTPHLSFFVTDVDVAFERLRASGEVELPAAVNPMGQHGRSFYIYDPDRVPVELWQQLDSSRDVYNRPGGLPD
jgi:glyoxylase I family protein